MSRYGAFNTAASIILGLGAISAADITYQAYQASHEPSPFHLACSNLGIHAYEAHGKVITQQDQEEALLKIFHIAGYLKPEKLWKDINKIGLENPKKLYLAILPAILESGADQDDPAKFNSKLLRKNLFKDTSLSPEDASDFLLYIAQHAFARNVGQERNELKSVNWMAAHKDLYMDCARTLGLVDRIDPSYSEYDEGWIAGASRIGLLARAIDYLQVASKQKVGDTHVLAGERPIWAEIDGISPDVLSALMRAHKEGINLDEVNATLPVGNVADRTAEGIEFIKSLAAHFGIELNKDNPVIIYEKQEDCPKGLFQGRHYPNYADGEQRKLTETLMSAYVLESLAADHGFNIINTVSSSGVRPDTATTAQDAAKEFVKSIKAGKFGDKKEFRILFQSNNPYIESQTIRTQEETNKVLKAEGLYDLGYRVIIDGVGFSSKQDVPTLHSELGALFSMRWLTSKEHSDRAKESLFYQTRDKSDFTEPAPVLEENSGALKYVLGGIKSFFDEYLE